MERHEAWKYIAQLGSEASHPDVRKLVQSFDAILRHQAESLKQIEQKLESLTADYFRSGRWERQSYDQITDQIEELRQDINTIAATKNIGL